MSILRSRPLLVFLFSLSVAPAFSAEEVKAGVTAPGDSSMTKQMARTMLKSAESGEEAKVNISSPSDGAIIKAMGRNKLKYEVNGADAYHARLYIDGNKSEFLRKRNGTWQVAKLPAGNHELCVKALNKNHAEVGKASCVKVTAQ